MYYENKCLAMKRFSNIIGVHASAYLVAKVAPAIAGFLMLPILVRSMAPEAFTRYGQGMALVNALIGFSAGWINQSQIRFVHQRDQRQMRTAKGIALLFNLAGGVGLIAITGILAGSEWWSEIFLFSAMLIGMMLTTDALARQFTARFVAMELARSVFFVAAILLAVLEFTTLPVNLVLASVGLSYLTPLPWSMHTLRRPHRLFSRRSLVRARGLLKSMWQFGWPVGAWICLISLMQVFDRSFVREVFGVEASAHYIALFEIYFRGVSLVTFPFVMSAYPEMIKLWAGGDREGALQLERHVERLQGFAFVPCVLISALSVEVSMPILGKAAAPGDEILAGMFAAGAIIWQRVLAVHKPLELCHRTIAMLFLALASLTVFAGVLLAVGSSGLIGVAATYIVSGLVYIVCCRFAVCASNCIETNRITL